MSRLTHDKRKRLAPTLISRKPELYQPHSFVELLSGASTKLISGVSELYRDLQSFLSSFPKLAIASFNYFDSDIGSGEQAKREELLDELLSETDCFDIDLSDRLWNWCLTQRAFTEAWQPFEDRPGKTELRYVPALDPAFRIGQRTGRELAFLYAACRGMSAAIVRKTAHTTSERVRKAAKKLLDVLVKEKYDTTRYPWLFDLSTNSTPLNYPEQWIDAHVIVTEFSGALLLFHRFSSKKGNPVVSSINEFLCFCGETDKNKSQIRKWLRDARH